MEHFISETFVIKDAEKADLEIYQNEDSEIVFQRDSEVFFLLDKELWKALRKFIDGEFKA